MPTAKPAARTPLLTTSQAATIHAATGLSTVHIRDLLTSGKRPTNPVTAAAWDEVIAELGLSKAVAK